MIASTTVSTSRCVRWRESVPILIWNRSPEFFGIGARIGRTQISFLINFLKYISRRFTEITQSITWPHVRVHVWQASTQNAIYRIVPMSKAPRWSNDVQLSRRRLGKGQQPRGGDLRRPAQSVFCTSIGGSFDCGAQSWPERKRHERLSLSSSNCSSHPAGLAWANQLTSHSTWLSAVGRSYSIRTSRSTARTTHLVTANEL